MSAGARGQEPQLFWLILIRCNHFSIIHLSRECCPFLLTYSLSEQHLFFVFIEISLIKNIDFFVLIWISTLKNIERLL